MTNSNSKGGSATQLLESEFESAELPLLLAEERNQTEQPNDLATLRFLRGVRQRAGITRVADITGLGVEGCFVYQATRPGIASHFFFGQNSGSQGKGATPEHAEISATMEALENYFAEPRAVQLIRGSHRFLSEAHAVLHPSWFDPVGTSDCDPADEMLMWTRAYLLSGNCETLVPAERVYFPFFPADYDTPQRFHSTSTGLAGGARWVDALSHGLNEVVERHWRALTETALPLQVHAVALGSASDAIIGKLAPFRAEFFLVHGCAQAPLTPLVVCRLIGPTSEVSFGYSAQVDTLCALRSALNEAKQAAATGYSGTREDSTLRALSGKAEKLGAHAVLPQTEAIALERIEQMYGASDINNRFDELDVGLERLRRAGYPHVVVKILTRHGLPVPMVRVIVPGTQHPGMSQPAATAATRMLVNTCQYSIDL